MPGQRGAWCGPGRAAPRCPARPASRRAPRWPPAARAPGRRPAAGHAAPAGRRRAGGPGAGRTDTPPRVAASSPSATSERRSRRTVDSEMPSASASSRNDDVATVAHLLEEPATTLSDQHRRHLPAATVTHAPEYVRTCHFCHSQPPCGKRAYEPAVRLRRSEPRPARTAAAASDRAHHVADLRQRAELAGRPRLDQQVADGGRLHRPGQHRPAGHVGGELAQQRRWPRRRRRCAPRRPGRRRAPRPAPASTGACRRGCPGCSAPRRPGSAGDRLPGLPGRSAAICAGMSPRRDEPRVVRVDQASREPGVGGRRGDQLGVVGAVAPPTPPGTAAAATARCRCAGTGPCRRPRPRWRTRRGGPRRSAPARSAPGRPATRYPQEM